MAATASNCHPTKIQQRTSARDMQKKNKKKETETESESESESEVENLR